MRRKTHLQLLDRGRQFVSYRSAEAASGFRAPQFSPASSVSVSVSVSVLHGLSKCGSTIHREIPAPSGCHKCLTCSRSYK
jgi:hypothetical protein